MAAGHQVCKKPSKSEGQKSVCGVRPGRQGKPNRNSERSKLLQSRSLLKKPAPKGMGSSVKQRASRRLVGHALPGVAMSLQPNTGDCNGLVFGPRDYHTAQWHQLSDVQQGYFGVLGWDASMWKRGERPPSDFMPWDRISTHATFGPAVQGLKYKRATWQADDGRSVKKPPSRLVRAMDAPGRVSSERLNVRAKPDTTSGKVMAELKFNDVVHVHGRLKTPRGWYKITTSDMQEGYVAANFVRIHPPEDGARLYRIKSKDTLFGIVGREYGANVRNRYAYANALEHANTGSRAFYRRSGGVDGELGVRRGTTIWLPSAAFMASLRSKVGEHAFTRAKWTTKAKNTLKAKLKGAWQGAKNIATTALKYVQIGAGFVAGILKGAVQSVLDTVVGIVTLPWQAVKLIISIFKGTIITKAKALWNAITNLSAGKLKTALEAKWKSLGSPWKKALWTGNIIGYVIAEAVMAFFSGGLLTAAKGAAKFGKIASLLSKLAAIKNAATAAAATKRAGAAKKFAERFQKTVRKVRGTAKKKASKVSGKKKKKKKKKDDPKKIARKLAEQGWNKARKKTQKQVLTKQQLKKALGRPKRKGATWTIVVKGKVWHIQAKVRVGKKSKTHLWKAGKGWIAKDGKKNFFLAKNPQHLYDKIVQNADKRIEAEASKLAKANQKQGKALKLEDIHKKLKPKIQKIEKKPDPKLPKGMTFNIKEGQFKKGKDKQDRPALIYHYEIKPNTDRNSFVCSVTGDTVSKKSWDINHPYVKNVLTDYGPYQLIAPGENKPGKFIINPHTSFKGNQDKEWDASNEKTGYQPESLVWNDSAKKFKNGSVNNTMKQKRIDRYRNGFVKNQVEALLGFKKGHEPRSFRNVVHEDKLGGHTRERHVLDVQISGGINNTRDVALRAIGKHPTIGAGIGGLASAFKTSRGANIAGGQGVFRQLKADWKNERIKLAKGSERSGPKVVATNPSAADVIAFKAMVTNPTAADLPAYLGLGTGHRVLYPGDENSTEAQAWLSAQSGRTIDTSNPLCKVEPMPQVEGRVRPCIRAGAHGWYLNSMWPVA